MKKSLIALAVMAAAGAASAQSSVTLFGIVDVNATYGRSSGAAGNHIWTMGTGGLSTSRLGVRGREDLGGGMRAEFWLEGQLFADDGRTGTATQTGNRGNNIADGSGLNFARRSTVSLGGNWGELRLGRDINPSGVVPAAYDPWGTLGIGAALGTAVQANGMGIGTAAAAVPFATTRGVFARSSNMFQYFAPANLGGFFGSAAYWLGENASNTAPSANRDDGDGGGVRLGFGMGPWKVEGSWARTQYGRQVVAATALAGAGQLIGDYTAWDIGGQWDFGVARVMGFYRSDDMDRSIGNIQNRSWNIGALVPVGPGEIKVAYGQMRIVDGVAGEPRARKISLGYVHNLSKRTALYTSIAQVRNRSGSAVALGTAAASVNQSSSGFDLGVRHAF